MIKEIELQKIEELLKKTTKGPWFSMIEGINHDSGSSFIMTGVMKRENLWSKQRGNDIEIIGGTNYDLEFIANCKQNIPLLISEIRRQRKLLNLNK